MSNQSPNSLRNFELITMFSRTAVRIMEPDRLLSRMAGGLNINKTGAIDGRPVADAYTASCYDQQSGIGMTAIIWGRQQFKCFLEIVASPGDGVEAMSEDWREVIAGRIMAQATREFIHALNPMQRNTKNAERGDAKPS